MKREFFSSIIFQKIFLTKISKELTRHLLSKFIETIFFLKKKKFENLTKTFPRPKFSKKIFNKKFRKIWDIFFPSSLILKFFWQKIWKTRKNNFFCQKYFKNFVTKNLENHEKTIFLSKIVKRKKILMNFFLGIWQDNFFYQKYKISVFKEIIRKK